MGRLDGRVALMTGAGRGFGRAMVMAPEYRARQIGELPVRHLGQVEDVAYSAVFLAAEQASYVTGQVFQPICGWVMV